MKEITKVTGYVDRLLDCRTRAERVSVEGLEDRYVCWRLNGLLRPVLLLVRHADLPKPTVSEVEDDVLFVRTFVEANVSYCAEWISATERMRLIRRRVPFVVPDRQLYWPFLGFSLREDGSGKTYRRLGGPAQRLLLTVLRNGMKGPLSVRQIRRLAGCSRATAFRMASALESFDLARKTALGLVFDDSLAQRIREIQPKMSRSAVRTEFLAALEFRKEDVL